ncbi:MAG: hypothetical protein CSA45_05180 [Gammaproteobacteria bacterium]|nr:MAG: hypothetical protein CSA45_05180 [Gammaproteobacteria bacterium]
MTHSRNLLQNQLNYIAILAGGRSRRMGTDKARLLFRQKILLRRLVEDARQQGLKPLLCADDMVYPEVEPQVITSPDLFTGKLGPLSAIQPALESCYRRGEKWLWVYACDSLLCPSQLYPYLQSALEKVERESPQNTLMILPKGKRLLPLMGLYRSDLYADLKTYLLQGHRRVMAFCHNYPVREVKFPESLHQCCNFNTPLQFALGKAQYTKYLQQST